tara:strand:- start:624 stop:983 length:360 start_codon:yes stop_codon:yes gene_type:complete
MSEVQKSPPLKWEFDNRGQWTAFSQIMEPDMTDEPREEWCREWCLSWTIYVDEDGDFNMSESDALLLREAGEIIRYEVCHALAPLKERIEILEQNLRICGTLPKSGVEVVLLPVEVYSR